MCYRWPVQRSSDERLVVSIPALALELAAPAAGYWLPGRGRAAATDYDIEGTHFAERCQVFVIIALGESIVVTGATASEAGLTSTVVLCLVVAQPHHRIAAFRACGLGATSAGSAAHSHF